MGKKKEKRKKEEAAALLKNQPKEKKPGRREGKTGHKTEFLQVYFTPTEKQEFQAFCDSIGVAASVYIRNLINKDRAALTDNR